MIEAHRYEYSRQKQCRNQAEIPKKFNLGKGERIAAGEPLATVDFGKVAAAGHSVVVVVTVVNAAELTVVTPLIGDGSSDDNGGDCKTVSAGSPIIDVEQ